MLDIILKMQALELRILRQKAPFIHRKYSKTTTSKWKSVVGLEVHAQINSNTKLFSGASNKFASPVNSNVSLFDCSIPGTLPVLNKKCVEAGVKTALALNCRINPISTFDRKHYFYADIPAGYQITQQRSPLALEGFLQFQVYVPGLHKKPYMAKASIKQIQLEQDSGKSLHEDDRSLVDLNRAGAPLMELVFEPDLTDGEEAAALVKELIIILQRIGTCTGKMEEGALRVDANVSIHKAGEPLGVRTEVKNIGSVRGVAGAIKYEIERQIKLLENGGKIVNETRAWEANSKITVAMRDKEQLQDYRYMPEPNLPPLHVAIGPIRQGCVIVEEIQKEIPELPEQTRQRLMENCGLTGEQAIILVNDPPLLNIFEEASKDSPDYKLLVNILINDILTLIHKEKLNLEDLSIKGGTLSEIIKLIQNGTINRNTSKLLIKEIVNGDSNDLLKIVERNNWIQINDPVKIEEICQGVLEENPDLVKQYLYGKTKLFKAFLGSVATKTNQRVNMALASDILKKLLEKQK